MVGTPWRVSATTAGPSYCIIASQLSRVSLASQGRKTARPGIARSAARCSMGWWVGPSSPRPMESWVKT